MSAIQLDSTGRSLDDGTLSRQPGKPPEIEFGFDDSPMAFQRRRGARLGRGFDFDPELFSTMVELIKDKNSSKFNFGPLLVAKMREIKDEGQVYFWELRSTTKKKQQAKREKLGRRRKSAFVRFGDFSSRTAAGRKGKAAGKFDVLYKVSGTTNCSTAVLDALYRALGGKIGPDGRVLRVGGVNGVPLSDPSFSGFPKLFQGPTWVDAIVKYKLGYEVSMRDLKSGDIISMPGHRMVYLETKKPGKSGWPTKISTIEAKPPTGKKIQDGVTRRPTKSWKAARIFDLS